MVIFSSTLYMEIYKWVNFKPQKMLDSNSYRLFSLANMFHEKKYSNFLVLKDLGRHM